MTTTDTIPDLDTMDRNKCTVAKFTVGDVNVADETPAATGRVPMGPVVDLELAPVAAELIGPESVARCADGNGTLTPLFFSDHVLDIARAKAICARCALQTDCLAEALDREEPWGVWGGELLSGGRIVARKRPGGRPPKRPRPPLLVDESGVVDTSRRNIS